MKKLLFLFCAMAISLGAFAQKGESAVGINLNVSPCLEEGASLTNFGIAAKYQYGITDALRGEAVLGYDFKAKGVGFFELGVNVDYLFKVANNFKVYPLVGLGYANAIFGEDGDDDLSTSRLYVNVGVGAEYSLTERIAVCIEAKYQYMKDFSRLPITLGVAYKF